MIDKIAVDKGVIIPRPRGDKLKDLYPWIDMEAGDSFFVPSIDGDIPKLRSKISTAGNRFINRYAAYNGYKIITRKVTENTFVGIRAWLSNGTDWHEGPSNIQVTS